MLDANSVSLAKVHPKEVWTINLSLLVAFVSFMIGIFGPLLSLNKFYIFSNTVSLASSLLQLVNERHFFIFALLFVFSIVMPVLKIVLLLRLLNGRSVNPQAHRRHLHWMAQYGKWSMLDVFVVAVLLVSVKLGVLADVRVHYGFYSFALATVITMLVTGRVARLGHP
jgi:paraquat-inducible protein A